MQNTKKTTDGLTMKHGWLVSLWLDNDWISQALLTKALERAESNFKKAESLKAQIEKVFLVWLSMA